jgi:two-component system CheB/CheR fusion protein
VLHELATNAAKHGSLSRARGRVKLSWIVGSRTDRKVVRLVWEETGGPHVDRPGPSGFGTSLIDSAIPGAAVSREFRPDGLVCTIEIPLGGEAERAAAQ